MPPNNPAAYQNPLVELRGQVIKPTVTDQESELQRRVAQGSGAVQEDTRNLRGDLASQARGLTTAPDRGELAARTFDLIRERSQPAYQRRLQDVGRRASALGRIGAGMTTSNLGDVASERNRFLTQANESLSLNAAQQALQDRLGTVAALRGVTGDLFNQDVTGLGLDASALETISGLNRGRRDELRGERGRADTLAEIANQRRIEQARTEAQLQNQLFNQLMGRAGMAGELGFGGITPLDAIPGVTREAGRQGQNFMDSGIQALQNFFLKRAQQAQTPEPVITSAPLPQPHVPQGGINATPSELFPNL